MLTLRSRLVLVNLLVFLLTFFVLASVLTSQLISHLYEQLDLELAAVSDRLLAHIVLAGGSPHLVAGANLPLPELGPTGFVRLLDAHGNVTDGLGSFRSLPVEPSALLATDSVMNQRSGRALLRVYTRPVYNAFAQNDGGLIGYVQTASVPEEVLEIVDQIRRSLLVATPLALLVAGIAGYLAAYKALQPLAEMTHSAAAISADSLSERRLPIPRTKDELQALALAFNAMLDRLAAAFIRQRRFTADASHELRTPVTVLLGQAELALSRPRTPEAYQAALVRIQSEAERMQRLIGRLLTLARAKSGQQVLSFSDTDVAALLRTIVDALVSEAEAKAVALHVVTPPSVLIETDADSLTQIVLNLLENAIAYTDVGEVIVTLTQRADSVCIEICDSGPGIDPEALTQIFEPFYRADPSRQRKNGGVGLGLALVSELAHLLGGRIEAANRSEGGAVFTLTLPQREIDLRTCAR